MTQQISWYYDFVSPYAYLQSHMLDRFDGKAEITCIPVLFAGLLNHWGQLGPAEMSTKRIWTYRYCAFAAEQQEVAFKLPPSHPFNPVNALRLMIAAGSTRAAMQSAFDFVWGEGHDPSDADNFMMLAERLGVSDAPARVSDQAVKDQLRANTDAAIAAGVYGVPTIQIDEELFWGMDGTDFALAYLADPSIMQTDNMQRAVTMPAAAERKR
jgi:2-hydroxychromene-2-carboxylate isomerase